MEVTNKVAAPLLVGEFLVRALLCVQLEPGNGRNFPRYPGSSISTQGVIPVSTQIRHGPMFQDRSRLDPTETQAPQSLGL
jgi:hypothetical protein